MKEIKNGTEVLIFSYNNTNNEYEKGTIIESKLSINKVRIYKVLGEDGTIYYGPYGYGSSNYIKTLKDYNKSLSKQLKLK